jgi:hypothetical protein
MTLDTNRQKEQNRPMSANDSLADDGLPAVRIAGSIISRTQQAIETRRALDATKPPPPAKIVQFPLPFPQETPPVCNVIARSALFAAIKSKDRRTLKQEVVASQDGVEIAFTGEQFNQDDHDTFMHLVQLASVRPLGFSVVVPANAILRALGRGIGKSQHDQLRADILRLVAGTVAIKANGLDYFGHLVDEAAQDTREPTHKRHWVYRLNPRLVALFAPHRFTLTNWQARQQLAQRDLARWLQLWLETHAENYPVGVATLLARCGSKNVNLRSFRQKLREALNDLKAAGVIHYWAIERGDKVHIDRTPSDSQQAHIRRKAGTQKAARPSKSTASKMRATR